MDTPENTIEVNKFARKERQMKTFSKSAILKNFRIPAVTKIVEACRTVAHFISEIVPASPQKKLLFQAAVIGITSILVSSFTPGGSFTAVSMSYTSDYISSYSVPGDILVSDENGYLIKINPQTDVTSRIGLTDFAVHTIEEGESLSVIAGRYGVNVETVMWENNLGNANSIRSGQKLMIPPVDGLSYTVASGDNLGKLAEKWDITAEAIVAQNALESETLYKGQDLFLPGAIKVAPINIAGAGYTASSGSGYVNYANVASSGSAPIAGKIFIYPTKGQITQGYHSGHYAIDISDTSKPAIWAAYGGTIEKSSTGTWGGGYGNHVIIDHGGGLKTLYAHMDSVAVSAGDYVGQGDVIGIMGNTGRVYGVTGIHLHWEVIQDGIKQYPGNYY